MNLTNESLTLNESIYILDLETVVGIVYGSKIVSGIALLLNIYVTISLIKYGVENKKFRWSEGDFFVFITTFTSSFLCCFRMIWAIFGLVILGLHQTKSMERAALICEGYNKINVLFQGVVTILSYLMLWKRQRVFYKSGIMTKDLGKTIIFLSKYTGVFITAGFISLLVYWLIYHFSPVSDGSDCFASTKSDSLPYLVAGVILLSSQVLTLVLFIVPLRKSIGFRRELTEKSANTDKLMKRTVALEMTMMRSLKAAVFCFSSDLISMIFKVSIPKWMPLTISMTMYDLALFVNVICLLLTFKNWREMISSALCCCQHPKQRTDKDTANPPPATEVSKSTVTIKTSTTMHL